MISTKGRYAVRILIDLGEHYNGEYIPMKDVATRQNVSLKYIERIIPVLVKAKLVDAVHGKGGGYKLNRTPEEYTVWEVLSLCEGEMAPVACLEDDAPPCERVTECKTIPMWRDYYKLTKDFFSKITIADLMKNNSIDNYII